MFAVLAWVVDILIPMAAGLFGGGLSLLASRVLFRKKQISDRPPPKMIDDKNDIGLAIPNHDPFNSGSSTEKRIALRRKGNRIEVFIEPTEQPIILFTGWVTDRSVNGLGIEIDKPVARGTRLNVLPANAPSVTPWVVVEVKNCRETKNGWEIGCQFPKQPPWAILLQFG